MSPRSRWYHGPDRYGPSALRLSYLTHAAYFFYRAVGPDENLASALNRILAMKEREELEHRMLPVPSPEEVHAMALGLFPAELVKPLVGPQGEQPCSTS